MQNSITKGRTRRETTHDRSHLAKNVPERCVRSVQKINTNTQPIMSMLLDSMPALNLTSTTAALLATIARTKIYPATNTNNTHLKIEGTIKLSAATTPRSGGNQLFSILL